MHANLIAHDAPWRTEVLPGSLVLRNV